MTNNEESHHEIIFELEKQGRNKNLTLTIDKKSESGWIFRAIDNNSKGTEFSCAVNLLNRAGGKSCAVEIARGRMVNVGVISRVKFYIKNLLRISANKLLRFVHVTNTDRYTTVTKKEDAAVLMHFIICKPLFRHLGIRFVEWQRSLDGPIKIYDLERGV